MTRNRFAGFKVCLNEACGHISPLCNLCGGDMLLKDGRFGPLGLSHYYRGQNPGCTNTLNKAVVAPQTSDPKTFMLAR